MSIPRRPLARLLAVFCLVLVGPLRPAHCFAQEGPQPSATSDGREPPRAAIAHYKQGRELYLAGRYREAVVELEAAVALDPDSPNLIYNLARVYELLGEIDKSIHHYKRYRDLLPRSEVEERGRVNGTLQRLEGAREHAPEEPTPRPATPVPTERGVADATFWTLAALSAGALIAGAAVGAAALDAEKDAKRFVLEGDQGIVERRQKERYADRLALGSDLSLLAGAVLGTTAILLFALREKPAKSAPRAVLDFGAGPKGGFVVLRGQL